MMKKFKVTGAGVLLDHLKQGHCLYRDAWIKDEWEFSFITKQIPSMISKDIVPNMQSLSSDAKAILLNNPEFQVLSYKNQIIKITSFKGSNTTTATYYAFTTEDLYSDDWYMITAEE